MGTDRDRGRSALTRRDFVKRGLGAAAGALALGGGSWMLVNRHHNEFRVQRVRPLMKTSVSVTAVADDPDHARHAIDAAFRRMAATASVLTRFDARSPVAVLNRDGHLHSPPAGLLEVLAHARHFSTVSDGAFDVTVLPVLDYYLGLERPIDPVRLDRRAVAERDQKVGYRHLHFDARQVRLEQPGMAITLDGIAKGYVVDQGIAALRASGIETALIDAGGEVHAISAPGTRHLWSVGVADPHAADRLCALVRLADGALSTSGNYEVFFSRDRRLFHIINPHTGYSPDSYASVTVFAARGVEADALGVTLFSLPLARVRALMRDEGREWFVVSWDGRRRWRSPGFPIVRGQADVV